MKLKSFLEQLSPEQRAALATACDTTLGHLKNIAYGYKPCSVVLAVALERETGGALLSEELAPWAAETIAYLKQSAQDKPTHKAA